MWPVPFATHLTQRSKQKQSLRRLCCRLEESDWPSTNAVIQKHVSMLHCDNENDDNMIMLTVTDHAVLHCLTSSLCGREALSVMPHMLCQSIEAVDIRPFSRNQLTLLLKFPPLLTLKQAFRLV